MQRLDNIVGQIQIYLTVITTLKMKTDDDDFVNAVDDEVEDVLITKEEEEVWADAVDEEDELQLPQCEYEYKINFHTKSFNPEIDMENPQFKLKMVFSSMVEVRNALAQYCVKERV
jgi:hypothetical protein